MSIALFPFMKGITTNYPFAHKEQMQIALFPFMKGITTILCPLKSMDIPLLIALFPFMKGITTCGQVYPIGA